MTFFDDPANLAPARTVRTDLGSGAFVLTSPEPLQPYARCVGEWVERWARETPDAPAFGEPSASGWAMLTWSELRRRIGAVAQWLLDAGLAPDRPVVILSDNSLDHLVLALAGMHVGIPTCAVSSAYSRLAQGDFTRIHAILRALDPALVFAADAKTYAPPLAGVGLAPIVVFGSGAESHPGAHAFAALLATRETPAVMAAFTRVTPDAHAKYLLTSGSTGHPKVVINTHRMLCANQQMMAQVLPFTTREKTVLLEWLPWSHTFGGNHNINFVLRTGGTMYINDGRPVPGLIEKTLAHLRTVQPTIYFDVPRGYELMLPALESDDTLARAFFGRQKMTFYAGSAMPAATWARLQAVARRVTGADAWITTSWGSTETAPGITFAHWKLDGPGVIGIPMPGVELKFVPNAGKLELRIRGDNIFPGYRNNDAATRQAFDEDGFYCIGDAGFLLDPARPELGVVFDGRVAEDFKLTSGTWVSVGTLRVRAVSALSPHVQDVVITGHDRSEVGMLVFLAEPARALPREQLVAHLQAGMRALAKEGGGSSQVPRRALVLPDAPSLAAGEITDKGYINQRQVLARRAAEVEALYASPGDPRVVRTMID